jgi:hypothetical protein
LIMVTRLLEGLAGARWPTILHDTHKKGEKHVYPFFTMETWHFKSNAELLYNQMPSLQKLSLQTRFLSVCLPYCLICGVLQVYRPGI